MKKGDFVVGSKKYIEELEQKGIILEEMKNQYVLVNPEGLAPDVNGMFLEKVYVVKNKIEMTEEKYKCIDCGKIKPLVIRYGRAIRCKECYENHLEKLRILRVLNNIYEKLGDLNE